MAEVSVWQRRSAAVAGILGQGWAAKPACVADQRRAAANHGWLFRRRLPEQSCVLRKKEDIGAKTGIHEGGPVVRGFVL